MSISKPSWTCLRCIAQTSAKHPRHLSQIRSFGASPIRSDEGLQQQSDNTPEQPPPATTAGKALDPATASFPRYERKLQREQHVTPIGSRRRRAALRAKAREIPFEKLPYQCFQDARKILAEDRTEKLKDIETQRARIARLKATQVEPQQEGFKEKRLLSMEQHLEKLKIYADINDPMVKRNFEDGKADLNKPVYRHLAEKKWRSFDRNINVQRIQQFNIVPDIVQALDPTVGVDITYKSRKIEQGQYVDSRVSEKAPIVNIQSYKKGERLVTVAVVNPDVPNVAKDSFDHRCHFLACNVKIDPTSTRVLLNALNGEQQVILPWLPAWTQKGAPYQRMAFVVLQQPNDEPLDISSAQKKVGREGFILRSFMDRHKLHPIGANLFRSQWDEGTAGVMRRLGIPGHDVEFKRKKIEPLPYKKLPGSRYR